MFKGMICFADRRVIPWLMALFFFLGLIIPCNALSTTSAIPQVISKQITGKVTEPDTATRMRLMESYSRLPLSFEANQGQTDEKVKFLSRGSGYNLFLASTEAVLSLRKAQPPKARIKDKAGKEPAPHKADKQEPATVVSMKLVGANPDPKIAGDSQLPGKVNYFLGKDPQKWRTNIPTYARVRYTNIYPGIDLVFYGQGQKLEYDFIVAPGADPDSIALSFGQAPVKIEQNGDLALDAKGGELRLQKPLIYQDIDGIRKPVPGGYVLHAVKNEKQTHRIGFKVADYDHTRPLVIDPVLVYSTYLGGRGGDCGYGIAVDATGNCYVAGSTYSTDFPTQDPLYPTNAGDGDAFVTSLSPAGDALIYSTYLGGSGRDYGIGIAVDATGNCYVTGYTSSTDFPTQDPLYPSLSGSCDAFVTSLSPAGDALIYSTYLGGSGRDYGWGIAVDATGNCYVTGYTKSTDFPTQDPLYPNLTGEDAFVTRLSPAGDALVYSTYLGGSGYDVGYGIAVDATGNCYVTGDTSSIDFPTQNPLYPNYAGGWDAFVTSLSPAGDALVYSTYLGGRGGDCGYGIAVDATGNCYVTGYTKSTDFPTQDPLYPNLTGDQDAFVTRLSPAGDALVYSTYLGGSSSDYGYGIAVDATGNCYVTGETYSTDFPTQDPLYPNLTGDQDAFVTRLSPAGDALIYSTYLGGSSWDDGQAIAVDATGNCYVTGCTGSTDFPTQNPLYPILGGYDAFVSKISDDFSAPTLDHFEFFEISSPQAVGTPFSVTITAVDASGNVCAYDGQGALWIVGGEVAPGNVTFSNGTWTGNVEVFQPGDRVQLGVNALGKSGASNVFDISGAAPSAGSLEGTVETVDGTPLDGAYVYLSREKDGPSEQYRVTMNGIYRFSSIASGLYYVWAEHNDAKTHSRAKFIGSGTVTEDLVIAAYCNPQGKIPILLVPGIMGSDTKYRLNICPSLPKKAPAWDSEKLVIHDPLPHTSFKTGWITLKEKLIHDYQYDLGCTLFEVPYDWRMDLNEAWQNYLKPWIDEAKAKSGASKVNIVAHSMGGLITRAYIQSSSFDNDIDHFLMVGTPNHGAATPYYIWEGGNPLLADEVNGFKILDVQYFYTNTLEKLMKKYYGITFRYSGSELPVQFKKLAHTMVHDHVPSLNQIMAAFEGVLSTGAVPKDKSDFLDKLNEDSDRHRMVDDNTGWPDKVMAKILAGNGVETIRRIDVGKPADSGPFYPTGVPLNDKPYRPESGDGAVLAEESAAVDFLAIPQCKEGKHPYLIAKFEDEIISFIVGEGSSIESLPRQVSDEPPVEQRFMLTSEGRVQPYVVDPEGRGSGINPNTDHRETGIPWTTVALESDGGSISLIDPPNGQYTLYLKTPFSEDYNVTLSYGSNEGLTRRTFAGFIDSETEIITFTMDSNAADMLTVTHSPEPPEGLVADAVEGGGLKTRLSWKPSTDPGVTGYNIYAKQIYFPYYSFLATCSSTSYDTGHSWAQNASIPTWVYVVSAITGDGTESFFSNLAQNNDRDHDGITDEEEVSGGTNPDNPDSDGDGLNDGEEQAHGTNPLVTDTDGDGYSDYEEIEAGSDPLNENSVPACTYAINPASADFTASGGTSSVDVTTQSGCSWTAASNDTWIIITSGSSGTGSGTVYYSVYANTSTSSRTGTMTIAGKTFTVNQEGISPEPIADFMGSPTLGKAPLTVYFEDLSTGEITSWSWDFGDAGTSTEQNPSHIYDTPGAYTVSLTVTGPGGTDTETKIDYITVSTEGWEGAYDTLFRDPSDLTLLRQYRDESLNKTKKGRLYTKLLYNSSEKALQVLLRNPELMMKAKHLIEANKDAVSEVLNGYVGVIYNTDEIVSFLKAYAKKSPPGLKLLAITVEKEMLRQQRQGGKFLGFRLE